MVGVHLLSCGSSGKRRTASKTAVNFAEATKAASSLDWTTYDLLPYAISQKCFYLKGGRSH